MSDELYSFSGMTRLRSTLVLVHWAYGYSGIRIDSRAWSPFPCLFIPFVRCIFFSGEPFFSTPYVSNYGTVFYWQHLPKIRVDLVDSIRTVQVHWNFCDDDTMNFHTNTYTSSQHVRFRIRPMLESDKRYRENTWIGGTYTWPRYFFQTITSLCSKGHEMICQVLVCIQTVGTRMVSLSLETQKEAKSDTIARFLPYDN